MYSDHFKKFINQTNLILLLDHAGRSGNGFFLTIFDQHEDVLSCPWMHYTYSYFLSMFSDNKYLDSKTVLEEWTNQQYFKLVNSDLDNHKKEFIFKIGGDPNAQIDRPLVLKIFRDIVSTKEHIKRRDVILATYFAYAMGIGRNTEIIKYILVSDSISLRNESVFTGYSGKIIDLVLNDFPSARLFHLVRDPRAGFASTNHQFINQLGNMYGLRWGNALSRLGRTIRLDFDWDSVFVFGFWLMYFRQTYEAAMRKRAEYPEKFTAIRNEDLNLDFCRTMRKITELLGIKYLSEWDKNEKFQPTMLGMPWRGTGAYNSRYSPSSRLPNDPDKIAANNSGPNRHVTIRWKSRLKKNEIFLIETFLKPEFLEMGYDLQNNEPNIANWRWLFELSIPLHGELPSIRWLKDGWDSDWRTFRDRLFFSTVWPVYYVLARYAFVKVVRNKRLFGRDCFTEK